MCALIEQMYCSRGGDEIEGFINSSWISDFTEITGCERGGGEAGRGGSDSSSVFLANYLECTLSYRITGVFYPMSNNV